MYAKVFASLWDGTLYGQSDAQLVFIFLLARADREGYVEATHQAIAGPTGLPLERVTAALAVLEAPDEHSRSDEFQGSRLERIDDRRNWGWRIVNYLKYRNMPDADTVRAQTRERQRQKRSRDSHAQSRSVTPRNAPSRQGEGEGEVEVEASEPKHSAHPAGERHAHAEKNGNGQLTVKAWFLTVFWPRYPRKVGKAQAFRRIVSIFKAAGPAREDQLGDAIMNRLHGFKTGEWSEREPALIPHPATFLNREDFLDA